MVEIPQDLDYRTRPRWILLAGWLSGTECQDTVRFLNDREWTNGTYSDGSFRDNVSVQFHSTKSEESELKFLYDRIEDTADHIAKLMNIQIDPSMHDSVQFSRWQTGNSYGMHTDNDPSGQTLDYDRKISLYCSLSPGGGLELDKEGKIFCNRGDALIISGIMPHAAPIQEEGERYSMVAWILGPRWT